MPQHAQQIAIGQASLELLTEGEQFLGVGAVRIGETLVRSGRLPILPWSQTFSGYASDSFTLDHVDASEGETRIHLTAHFTPAPFKLMRDHSFDPIHDVSDWDGSSQRRSIKLALVLRPARRDLGGYAFEGFDYHWAFESDELELFFLLDRSSFELDGDVTRATAVSQSSCSDPLVTFEADTEWTTEGVIHFMPDIANPIMTHNLPRWASHQAFDFQYKGDATLIGVFERVDLIRSLLRREAGAAELKCFDKHIFDQTDRYATSPKAVLLNSDAKTQVDQQNLWTWTFDAVHEAARYEFGLKEEPALPRVGQNYWHSFTIDTYYKDLLPATEAIGAKQVFIDNVNKSDMTEPGGQYKQGNMCCGHEYEPAEKLGGEKALAAFVERCKARDIQVMSWTNNDQSYASPVQKTERDERNWFVKMEDTRLKYGGAYTNVFTILDFANDDARQYWVDCMRAIREKTGLNGYLFDSFYNLGFMPVSYSEGRPTTMWRQTLEAFKELQDAGVHFLIESFGPFGQPQHGCPRSYSIDRCWICYTIGLGNDYTTVPTGKTHEDPRANDAAGFYYTLAHKTLVNMPLFKDGQRIDERFGPAHRQALADYHAALPQMRRRFLQEDGQGVLWHDEAGQQATLFNFTDRSVDLPADAQVHCLSSNRAVPMSGDGQVEFNAHHTYTVKASTLPARIGSTQRAPLATAAAQ